MRVPRGTSTPLVVFNPKTQEKKKMNTPSLCVAKRPLVETIVKFSEPATKTSYSIQHDKGTFTYTQTEQGEKFIKQQQTETMDNLNTKSHPQNLHQWTVDHVYSYLLQSDCSDQAHIFKEQVKMFL